MSIVEDYGLDYVDENPHMTATDMYHDMDAEIDQNEPSMKQIGTAVAVVDELGNVKEGISREMDYTPDVHKVIEVTVESLFKIASIGMPNIPMPDLMCQCQEENKELTLQEASLESLEKTITMVWEKIIAAVKRAWAWLKSILARFFSLEKKTKARLSVLEDLASRGNELRSRINAQTKILPKFVSFKYDSVMEFFFEQNFLPTKKSSLAKLQAEGKELRQATDDWQNQMRGEMFFSRKVPAKVEFTKNSKIVEMSEDLAGWRMFRTAPVFPKVDDSDPKYYKTMAAWVRGNDFRVDTTFVETNRNVEVIELDISSVNFSSLHHELTGYQDLSSKMREHLKSSASAMEKTIRSLEAELRRTNYDDKKDEAWARDRAAFKAAVFAKLSLGPLVIWSRRLDAITFSAVRQATDYAQQQVTHLEQQLQTLG